MPRRPVLRRLVAASAMLGISAAVAVLLPAPPAGAAALPRPTSTETYIGDVLKALINTERAAHHLPLLHMSGQLMLSAREHDVAMARYNRMSHQLPGEPYFATRISRTGYHWSWVGENIGWNSSMTLNGVLALEKLMYAERPPNDSHRLNILNSHFQNVGVDVYFDKAHHKVWLTTDFGRRS